MIAGPLGIAAPFVIDAVSNVGVNAAIVWWREPKKPKSGLPVERFGQRIADRLSLRGRNNPALRIVRSLCVASRFFSLRVATGHCCRCWHATRFTGWSADLWTFTWRDRSRCGGRLVCAADAEGAHGTGPACCGCEPRDGDRVGALRHREGTARRVNCVPYRRRRVHRRDRDAQRLGASRAAGLGTRARTFNLHDGKCSER